LLTAYSIGILAYFIALKTGSEFHETVKVIIAFSAFILCMYFAYKRRYSDLTIMIIILGFIGFEVPEFLYIPRMRIEDLILLTIIPLILVLDKSLNLKTNRLILYLLMLTTAVYVSTTTGHLSDIVPFNIRDYFVALHFTKLAIFALFVNSIKWSEQQVWLAIKVIIICSSIASIIALGQSFNNSLALELSKAYYITTEWHMEGIGELGRQSGTVSNANTFARILSISFAFLFSCIIVLRGKKAYIYSCMLIIVAGIIVTGSRSVLFSLPVVFVIGILHSQKRLKILKLFLFIIMLSLPIFYIFTYLKARTPILDTMNEIIRDPYSSGSFRWRWGYSINVALELFNKSPFFGVGPGKGLGYPTDSEYYYVLSRYGIIGSIAFALLYIDIIFRSYKYSRDTILLRINNAHSIYALSVMLFTIGFLVSNIGGAILTSHQVLANLYIVILSIFYSFSSKVEGEKILLKGAFNSIPASHALRAGKK